MCMHMYIHIHIHIYSICICIHIYVYMHIYIYVCVCTCIYIYIYIYIHIPVAAARSSAVGVSAAESRSFASSLRSSVFVYACLFKEIAYFRERGFCLLKGIAECLFSCKNSRTLLIFIQKSRSFVSSLVCSSVFICANPRIDMSYTSSLLDISRML